MAQTTGQMTFRNVKVELSSDGSTWFDISGSTSAVTVSGGNRSIAEIKPLFRDTVIGRPGARERVTVGVKSVYTENPAEASDLLSAAYLAGSMIYFRWSPTGGSAGARRYKTNGAYVIKTDFPGGNVSEANPLTADYSLSAEYVEKESV